MTAFSEVPFGDALFEMDREAPAVSLSDRFGIPPFSVLDRRSGEWMDRKRRWLSMGLDSGAGRGDHLAFSYAKTKTYDYFPTMDTTSVFDPVLAELIYRWFTRPGAKVLDPFCGGSVRGVVASTLARWYTGVDVRQEQIDANNAHLDMCSDITPNWLVGDATKLGDIFGAVDEYDLIFSCPPYADLEVYSKHPRDISTWDFESFVQGHAKAVKDACALLRDDRYAAWVIGDVRDKRGVFRGLHHATVAAFNNAGLRVVNEFVTIDPVGTAAIRAGRPFVANRKATTTHQHVLVFVKGDVRAAADWANSTDDVATDDDDDIF